MMMKRIYFLLFNIALAVNALAIEGHYAVSDIPPPLLKNANAVKRYEEIQFNLKNPGEAILKKKYAITILNENGERFAGFVQGYDKFNEIRSIEGRLYDAFGKEVKRLKSKDLQDLSGVEGANLMVDTRYKEHVFYYKIFPYTIEYEVEVKYNGTMFYPQWFPQGNSLLSVEESHFTFSSPADYQVRFKAFQFNQAPVETNEKGTRKLEWKTSNLPAIVLEPFSPGLEHITPLVLLGPTEFEMQDYKGNMKSWNDLGKFIAALKKGRDVLPEAIRQKVHQLTDNVNDPSEKVRVLYDFLQKNTRYISIQLGIGGWQPYDAGFVASKRYGDCKALTNYMYSLLKEAGIPSYYAAIKAGDGEEDIFTDFPSSQFDHVILCVPLGKDTTWLECTSQDTPPGYMGGFTGNRHALLVTEDGGVLVKTPAYGTDDNLEARTIKASIDESGTLTAQVSTRYRSMEQDDIHGMINALSKEKVKEYLHEKLDFATYEVNDFKYTEQPSAQPVIDEQLALTVSNYATVTGKRLFVTPNIMTRDGRRLASMEARKYDVVLSLEYHHIDTVEIQLPKGYKPEAMPKDASIATKFGTYQSSVRLKDDKIIYTRSMERFKGQFPAAEYEALIKFFEEVYRADRSRLVLVKEE